MTRDRSELQRWYRQAMARRIEELRALRPPLRAADPTSCDRARAVGQALRGSGATFGFSDLSAVATVLETSEDRAVLRRVEGLVSELLLLCAGDAGDQPHPAEWLLVAAGLPLDASTLAGVADLGAAWAAVAEARGWDGRTLVEAVADYLHVEVADLGSASPAARRLVPEALVAAGRVVPLSEDGTTITVATAEPTSLPLELQLRRVTGRAPIFAVAEPDAIDAALTHVLGRSPPAAWAVRPFAEEREGELVERRVLVVDDEATARLLTRALLEKKGFEVVEARDGLSAIAAMQGEDEIGLVVADLNMPDMDGLELLWELRGEQRWERVPVIVVTGEMDEALETQLIEEGADDYIRKPLDPRLFLARVEATMRRLGSPQGSP